MSMLVPGASNDGEDVQPSSKDIVDLTTREGLTNVFLNNFFKRRGRLDSRKKERIEKTVRKNMELLENMGVDIKSLTHSSVFLFISDYLEAGILICGSLEVDSFAVLSDIVHALDSENKGVFSKSLFAECIENFGKEKIREVFTCNGKTLFDERGMISDLHLYQGSLSEERAERKKFVQFCTQTCFPSGDYVPLIRFMEDVKTPAKQLHFLGSYAPEMRYMMEHFSISFETLFALNKNELGLYCGILKSLSNGYYRSMGMNDYISDFSYGRTPVPLSPEQIFSYESIANFNFCHEELHPKSLRNIKKLFHFLRQHSTNKKIPLLDRNEMKELRAVSKIWVDQKAEEARLRQEAHMREIEELAKKLALENKQLSRSGRNFNIITSLAKTIAEDSMLQSVLLEDGSIIETNDIKLLRTYLNKIKQSEEQYRGLYSIGGKIHFPEAIPEEKINKFRSDHGFTSTMFRMIHSNTSLLLPPTQQSWELQFMIGAMHEHGLLSGDPQLQISIPGRIPNGKAAILASSMLLLTNEHVKYSEESFATTHDSDTGRMMIAYDAGVYDPRGFKWNTNNIKGRTDILLLKDMNLIPKAQVIGSMLSQTEYDGMFADLGVQFIMDYCELLSKYDMGDILHAPWIYNLQDNEQQKGEEQLSQHIGAIHKLTEHSYMDHLVHNTTQLKKGLLTFELKSLLTQYLEKIQSIQRRFSQ